MAMATSHLGSNPKHFSRWGSLQFLKQILSDEHNVLDLGCGSGDLTWEIGRLVKNIVGVDIDDGAIQKATSLKSGNNIKYVCADVDRVLKIRMPIGTAAATHIDGQGALDLNVLLSIMSEKLL